MLDPLGSVKAEGRPHETDSFYSAAGAAAGSPNVDLGSDLHVRVELERLDVGDLAVH